MMMSHLQLLRVVQQKQLADILKDIADVPHRRACLETFCSCMNLVEWVRSVAKS